MESDRQDGAATAPEAGLTRAEQVLRANQQLLEPAADANPSMLYLYSLPERRTIYMNHRIEALLGYSREEIGTGGRDFVRSLFHPDDLPAVRRQPGEYATLGDGAMRQREYRIKHRDGGWRWFRNRESVFSRDDQGNPELILGASEDVTDQVEAEAALRASQRLFARVADTVPSIVYVYDLIEQRSVFVNRQLEATLGYPIEQFQRNPFGVIDEFIHEDDRKDLAASLGGGLAGIEDGQVLEREFRLRDARGEWRWLHTRHVVFARTTTGAVRQVLGVADDVTERKRAAQALSESQAFFKLVVNAAPIVLYLHDQTTKQDLFVNDQAEAVFGRPPEIGHEGFLDLVHREDLDHLLGAGERLAAVTAGGVVETEFRARHASGEWRWYQDRVVALTRTEDGRPARVLGAIQDTTDRRRAEEALREREHLLERVADSLPQLVYLYDLSAGRLQYVNRQVSKMLGYSPEEMKRPGADLLSTIVHPEDWERVKRLFPEDLATRDAGAIEFECRVRHANGDWRWLLCRHFVFTRAADGSAEQVLGTIDDVTEHKLAGENLVRFSLAIESSSDAIAMADATGRVTYVNPRFAELFGYTAEDLNVVQPAVRLFDEETEGAMREAIFAGRLWTHEVEIKVKGGQTVPCLLRVGPIQDAAGQMVGFYSVTTDITERRQREEQARQHQAELTHAQRISTLGEMAAGLAHELNQPLSAIASYASGCARRIRSGAGDPEELLAVVEQISEEALRGGEIIRRLKELVQKRDLRREPVDVNSLVHDVVHLVESDVRQGDVAVQLELAERLPRPGADRIQVEQVLLNLVRNALESMHQCGNGHAAGGPRAELSIRTVQLDGDTIELRIRDSGSGVPEALAERIFEPFFSTKAEGLGMGLSISRSIIEAHGGRLWATVNEDAGTTFHVTLPLGTAPPHEELVR